LPCACARPSNSIRAKGGPTGRFFYFHLTRGQDRITKETIRQFVEGLELAAEDKQRLLDMSPASYTGMAETIVGKL